MTSLGLQKPPIHFFRVKKSQRPRPVFFFKALGVGGTELEAVNEREGIYSVPMGRERFDVRLGLYHVGLLRYVRRFKMVNFS